MSPLAEVFRRHGTDKYAHGYFAFYETLPEPKRMLEVGVYKGASLRAWREWWPKVQLWGIDTFERNEPPADLDDCFLITGDARTHRCGQLLTGFQLLIDDGSHKPRDQAATFRNLWPLLAPGGHYCIEDVVLYDQPLPKWFQDRAADFNAEAGAHLLRTVCDAGVIFTMHDYRLQSGKPDSVLLVIRKP